MYSTDIYVISFHNFVPIKYRFVIHLAVVYICTEDSFPSKRLKQMMDNIPPPFKNRNEIPYGDRIYIEHISDVVSNE